MEGFSIKQVLGVSIEAYKNNWRVLLLIAIISALIVQGISLYGMVLTFIDSTIISLLAFVGYFIVLIVCFYFAFRLGVTSVMASHEVLNEREVSIPVLFKEAKKYTLKTIRVYFRMGVILIAPSMIAIVSLLAQFNGSILVAICGVLLAIYLSTIYIFAYILVTLEPGEKNVFARSRKIVKKRFFTVLLFSIIVELLATLNIGIALYVSYLDAPEISKFIWGIIVSIPGTILAPLGVLILVNLMHSLVKEEVVEVESV